MNNAIIPKIQQETKKKEGLRVMFPPCDMGSNPGDRTLLRLFELVSLAVILFWLKEVCFRVGCWFRAWRRLISCCVRGLGTIPGWSSIHWRAGPKRRLVR